MRDGHGVLLPACHVHDLQPKRYSFSQSVSRSVRVAVAGGLLHLALTVRGRGVYTEQARPQDLLDASGECMNVS